VGKKKSGATPLKFYSSYGWTNLSPMKMAERMQQATEDIIALKKKLNFQGRLLLRSQLQSYYQTPNE